MDKLNWKELLLFYSVCAIGGAIWGLFVIGPIAFWVGGLFGFY